MTIEREQWDRATKQRWLLTADEWVSVRDRFVLIWEKANNAAHDCAQRDGAPNIKQLKLIQAALKAIPSGVELEQLKSATFRLAVAAEALGIDSTPATNLYGLLCYPETVGGLSMGELTSPIDAVRPLLWRIWIREVAEDEATPPRHVVNRANTHLTISQAAKHFGIPLWKLRGWVRRKTKPIPSRRIPGETALVVLLSDVESELRGRESADKATKVATKFYPALPLAVRKHRERKRKV